MKMLRSDAKYIRALERVERAAVDVTNEITINVDRDQWTKGERALMRAIEQWEDIAWGTGRRSRGRGARRTHNAGC